MKIQALLLLGLTYAKSCDINGTGALTQAFADSINAGDAAGALVNATDDFILYPPFNNGAAIIGKANVEAFFQGFINSGTKIDSLVNPNAVCNNGNVLLAYTYNVLFPDNSTAGFFAACYWEKHGKTYRTSMCTFGQ